MDLRLLDARCQTYKMIPDRVFSSLYPSAKRKGTSVEGVLWFIIVRAKSGPSDCPSFLSPANASMLRIRKSLLSSIDSNQY